MGARWEQPGPVHCPARRQGVVGVGAVGVAAGVERGLAPGGVRRARGGGGGGGQASGVEVRTGHPCPSRGALAGLLRPAARGPDAHALDERFATGVRRVALSGGRVRRVHHVARMHACMHACMSQYGSETCMHDALRQSSRGAEATTPLAEHLARIWPPTLRRARRLGVVAPAARRAVGCTACTVTCSPRRRRPSKPYYYASEAPTTLAVTCCAPQSAVPHLRCTTQPSAAPNPTSSQSTLTWRWHSSFRSSAASFSCWVRRAIAPEVAPHHHRRDYYYR